MDLNAIISAALAAAVEQATKPLLDRITALESLRQSDAALLVALSDSVAKTQRSLENRIDGLSGLLSLANREPTYTIAGTEYMERIMVLETMVERLQLVLGAVYRNPLSENTLEAIRDGMPDGLMLAEQMHNRIKGIAESTADEYLDSHARAYNHDAYFRDAEAVLDAMDMRTVADSLIEDGDLIDKIKESGEWELEADEDEIASTVRSLLRDATINI